MDSGPVPISRFRSRIIGVVGLRVFPQPGTSTLARELGAAWVGGALDAPPDKLQSAIIFAPAGEIVPVALRALERGGTLALAGIHMTPIPSLDYDREVFGERVIRSVTANTRQDALELLREAAAIPVALTHIGSRSPMRTRPCKR